MIRNAYGVSPAMRERVTAAIEALDYRPRVAARAMRGSSFTFGIEIPHIGNPFFTKIVAGATAALQGTEYQLIIAPADFDGEEGVRAIGALADRQVDGIVAISPLVSPDWLERLAARVPIVMLGRHDRSTAYDTVTGDDIEGTRLVMEHLFELGHRRIVHLTRSEEVTRPGSGNPHAVRLEQYLAHMHDAGLDGTSGSSAPDSSEEAARLDTLALLDEEVPTAIFVGNDELALGTLRALSEHGLSACRRLGGRLRRRRHRELPGHLAHQREPGRRGHGRAGHPPAARTHRGSHRAHRTSRSSLHSRCAASTQPAPNEPTP